MNDNPLATKVKMKKNKFFLKRIQPLFSRFSNLSSQDNEYNSNLIYLIYYVLPHLRKKISNASRSFVKQEKREKKKRQRVKM